MKYLKILAQSDVASDLGCASVDRGTAEISRESKPTKNSGRL